MMNDKMIKTITDAGFGVDEFLKVCKTIGGLSLASPALIQGYTAEQWQEIIDGGYLCEFNCDLQGDSPPRYYGKLLAMSHSNLFRMKDSKVWFDNCRPAQIKGVMRPIFVLPSRKEAMCMFFDEHGCPLGYIAWCDLAILSWSTLATKYIEV